MALFGNLKHTPLPELLPALVKRTGRLRVFTRAATMLMEVNQGILIHAYRNKELLDLTAAKAMLMELIQIPEAAYEFVGDTIKPTSQAVNYFLPNMMVDLVAIAEPRSIFAEQFIDPLTRFRLTDQPGYPPGDLGRFYGRIQYLLDKPMGASSAELSKYLNVHLQDILYDLYSLRQMGYIAALEAIRIQQEAAKDMPEESSEPKGSFQRLFQGFKRKG